MSSESSSIYKQRLILLVQIIYSTHRRMIIFMILSFLLFYIALKDVVSLNIIFVLTIILFYAIPCVVVWWNNKKEHIQHIHAHNIAQINTKQFYKKTTVYLRNNTIVKAVALRSPAPEKLNKYFNLF